MHRITLVLSPGQFPVFFTDGVSDSFDADNTAPGLAGLRDPRAEMPTPDPETLVHHPRRGEARPRKEVAPRDDITILWLGVPS